MAVENAFYADSRISEVAAIGVPDKRLGELVVAVVFIKRAFQGKVSEAELLNAARTRLVIFDTLDMYICDTKDGA